jgi:endoglucanase
MRHTLLPLAVTVSVAACLLAGARAGRQPAAPADVQDANRRLGRGINLGNALDAPREGQWGVTLKPQYFRAIKEAGFDTVRLPVRWSSHAADEAPYTIDPEFAARVDWAVGLALANRLNIIVNVHHYDELHADPGRHVPRLVGLWEQIAARYKDRPAGVYLELLNEPHGALTEERWNAAIPRALEAVRRTNPSRPVIVGPASWNAIRALDKLGLPADDHNLILTVHHYEPFSFTHQGAPWMEGSGKWKGRKWEGREEEQAAVRGEFEKAAAWGREHGRPVFLGEFGAFEAADMESRARWTRFVAAEAQRQGFSWAYWEFCSGFGAYDPQASRWREPLKAALVGR